MRITPVLWISLLAAPLMAHAAEDDRVDLNLPSQPMFTGEAAFGGETYTGPRTDTPEYRARHGDDLVRRGGCPTAPDGSERTVTGSVTTGIGYSSRGGNSHFNAADISLCKETVSDAGNLNTMQLNLRVAQFDGPGAYGHGPGFGAYGGYGGYGAGRYFDGFGPGYQDLYGPMPGPRVRSESWTEGRQPWR
ncbi:conserved exported hypothetical protein [Luteimonas sp. 9C]|uniref:hypothetical protein n=1 Tax=Luteimonas sp. 9C TaxID=2653148 RepID=UPI0012F19442|nr:hypothetical protein [Luteimonas sp. 9C]VXC02140.1 conserved exported hypothetical protein [Luteimonas sp. 9C]